MRSVKEPSRSIAPRSVQFMLNPQCQVFDQVSIAGLKKPRPIALRSIFADQRVRGSFAKIDQKKRQQGEGHNYQGQGGAPFVEWCGV